MCKLIFCGENIAFLIKNHELNRERRRRAFSPDDVSIITRGWTGSGVAIAGGSVAVLVRYPAGLVKVVQATLVEGENIIEELCRATEYGIALIT
jgi:hypothetical protein